MLRTWGEILCIASSPFFCFALLLEMYQHSLMVICEGRSAFMRNMKSTLNGTKVQWLKLDAVAMVFNSR